MTKDGQRGKKEKNRVKEVKRAQQDTTWDKRGPNGRKEENKRRKEEKMEEEQIRKGRRKRRNEEKGRKKIS